MDIHGKVSLVGGHQPVANQLSAGRGDWVIRRTGGRLPTTAPTDPTHLVMTQGSHEGHDKLQVRNRSRSGGEGKAVHNRLRRPNQHENERGDSGPLLPAENPRRSFLNACNAPELLLASPSIVDICGVSHGVPEQFGQHENSAFQEWTDDDFGFTQVETNGIHRGLTSHRRTWAGGDATSLTQLPDILAFAGANTSNRQSNRHSFPSGKASDCITKPVHTNAGTFRVPSVFMTTRVTIKNREFICLSSERIAKSSLSGNRNSTGNKKGNRKHSDSVLQALHQPERLKWTKTPSRCPLVQRTNIAGYKNRRSTIDRQRNPRPQYGIACPNDYGKLPTSTSVQSVRSDLPYRHKGGDKGRPLLYQPKTHSKSNKVTLHKALHPEHAQGHSVGQGVSAAKSRKTKDRGVLEHFNKAFDPGVEKSVSENLSTGNNVKWCSSQQGGRNLPPFKHRRDYHRDPSADRKSKRASTRRAWRSEYLEDTIPVRIREFRRVLKLRKDVATSLLLTSIAGDLDVMLHDLCRSIPYPSSSTRSEEERHLHGQHVERELELLEHYMDGLGQEDEEEDAGSAGSLDERDDSNASSELDFYSAGEEMEHSSGFYFASSEADSPPPPVMPAPPVPIMPGEETLERHHHPHQGRAIPLMERLVRTHALWYLPNIGRAGAVHLLQNKEIGNFIVRQSSRADTMALSVRLRGKPRVEHYLVESTNRGLRLEGSFHHFSAIPVLIAYYCEHHRDELPVTLTLPKSVNSATTHQELGSLALLGQDFWTTTISPKKDKASNLDRVIPYHTTNEVSSQSLVTMATQLNASGQHQVPSHLKGVNRALPQKSALCHKSEVIKTFVSSINDANNGCSVNQSFQTHTKTFQNDLGHSNSSNKHRASPPRLISNVIQNGHHSPNPVNDEDIYDNTCRKNKIIRPVVTKAEGGQRTGYYGGSLEDRLSDYEDVWTTNNQSSSLTFRPIQTARSVQELVAKSNKLDSERSEQAVDARFSAVNPGYITDSCSEKDLTDSKLYSVQKKPTKLSHTVHHREERVATSSGGITTSTTKTTKSSSNNFPQPPPRSTKHQHHHRQQQTQVQSRQQTMENNSGKQSEIHRNEVVIGLKQPERRPDPVVFTFDLKNGSHLQQQTFRAGSEPREPPSRQAPTPPVRRHRLEKGLHHHHQRQQQQYNASSSTDQFETLLERLNGSQLKTSSSRGCNGAGHNGLDMGDEVDRHSVKLELIASPRLLERSPHYRGPPQAESYENAPGGSSVFQRTATLSRSHDLLTTPSGGASDQTHLTGQGALDSGGGGVNTENLGYTRSLSLPRHLQDLSMAEYDVLPAHSAHVESSSMTGAAAAGNVVVSSSSSLTQQQLSQAVNNQQKTTVTACASGLSPSASSPPQRLSPQSFSEHFSFPYAAATTSPLSQHTSSQVNTTTVGKQDGTRDTTATTPSPPVGRFPVYDNHHFGGGGGGGGDLGGCSDEESTVEDLIADVSPDLTVQPLNPLTISNVSRMSEYDNVNGLLGGGAPSSRRTGPGSSVATYYCQPWDSSLWDDLLNLGSTAHQPRAPPSWMGSQLAPGGVRGDGPLGDDYDDAVEKASSVGGFSSVFPGSIADSVPLNIDVIEAGSQYDGQLSEGPMTCQSEAATSFEWQNDRDSAAETTPQPPLLPITPTLDSAMGGAEGDHDDQHQRNSDGIITNNFSSLGTGKFDRFQDISDDEGVEDVGTGSFRDRLMPFLGSKRLSNLQRRGKRNAGVKMRDYITNMADNKETIFGVTIENFIKCTMEGSETNPHIVTRNVRQFMNGMKNYLIHHGEENLNVIIEEERSKLESDEFLNIDAIIEGALHKAVIKPLKHYVYQLFVEEYRRVGALKTLSDNIRFAQTKSAQELGIREGIVPPEGAALEEIRVYLEKMQRSYSPLKKLENLLGATSAIYNSVQNHEQTGSRETMISLGADDFLPLFVWVLVQCGMVSAEVEAEYMWGLLHPCLLAGEGGYYLTTLSSAVTALKNFKHSQMTADLAPEQPRLPNISDLQGFMKILIPDEIHDSIITKTLPVRPNMTARDVCTMIAHKFKITNPQDYGLYVLIDGEEDRLADNISPQATKADLICEGRKCVFAYKRNNAKFVWPVTISR